LPSAWKPKPPGDVASEQISLSYLTDNVSGIRRLRRGKGFIYLLPNGKRLSIESDVFRRIRALVIPPAWTNVWISPFEASHIQATGRDLRGRKQYRYHDSWRTFRDRTKFDRLPSFAKALSRLRAKVRHDLRLPGISRDKVLATVVRLLDRTLIRVGNDEYARQNRSYGLTTLRDRHANIRGSVISFSFRGKSGKQHTIRLDDARLARIVRRCQELPGQELLQYVDEEGNPRPIGSREVNDYVREISGQEFTAKDFRTWHGTTLAVTSLNALGTASSKGAGKRNAVKIIKAVAELLGNTPAVCRKSYIHPAVLSACENRSTLPPPLRGPRGLSLEERQTLALLLDPKLNPRLSSRGRSRSSNLPNLKTIRGQPAIPASERPGQNSGPQPKAAIARPQTIRRS
jgi:DNA topoisomerase I